LDATDLEAFAAAGIHFEDKNEDEGDDDGSSADDEL
jgi:hypothetical protein